MQVWRVIVTDGINKRHAARLVTGRITELPKT